MSLGNRSWLIVALLLIAAACGRSALLSGNEGQANVAAQPGSPTDSAAPGPGVDAGGVAFDASLPADLSPSPAIDQGSDAAIPIGVPVVRCASDSLPAGTQTGTAALPSYAVDFVPLCDGWIALSDDDHNQLGFFNPVLNQRADGLQLDARPGELALDRENDVVYAALAPATGIAKINLGSSVVTKIDGPAVSRLALGNGGQVLGLFNNYPKGAMSSLSVFDSNTDAWLKTLILPGTDGIATRLVYDRTYDYVLSADNSVIRYVFDRQNLAVTAVQSIRVYSEDADAFAISPDGRHVAAVWGAIYQVSELGTDDLSAVAGIWKTGAYPVGAAFSDDGKYFATTNDYQLMVFDANTYALVTSVAPPSTFRCNGTIASGGDRRVGFSRGGRLAFMLTPSCVFQTTGGFVVYTTLP